MDIVMFWSYLEVVSDILCLKVAAEFVMPSTLEPENARKKIQSHDRLSSQNKMHALATAGLTTKIISPYIRIVFYTSCLLILENYYSIFYK